MSFAVNWLSVRLPVFLDQNQGNAIRIISSVWSDPFDKEAFDFDIQYGTSKWPGFTSHRLTWETITHHCAPELPSRIALNTAEDLRIHRFLHVLGYQEGWGIWLNAANVQKVDAGSGLQLIRLCRRLRSLHKVAVSP